MAATETERQLIAFSLHGEQYAVPIASVQEIIRYTPPGVTAAATDLVRGMISLRGRVLPVADLSSRLGRALEVGSATRILIIELTNGSVGLIVDSVDGVLHVAESEIAPLPASMAGSGLGDEIATVDDRLVMLVDPERAVGAALPTPPRRRRTAPRSAAAQGRSRGRSRRSG